jgi:hypothetical protein
LIFLPAAAVFKSPLFCGFCFRWHPRFAVLLLALPLCGATLANRSEIADARAAKKASAKQKRQLRRRQKTLKGHN